MADVTLTDVSKALGFEESKARSTESYYGYIVRIDPDDPTSPYIIERNGKFYYSVLIDGTDKPIECARLVNATLGDRVLVGVMQNGHSVVTNRIDGDLNANDAIELAGTASTKADNALTAANNAQSAASAANEYASRAFTAASEAQTSADSALTAANAAQTSASNALTAANNAQTSADAAQSSADSAFTAASEAQTSADSALTAANNAQTSADAAQTSADEAADSAQIANSSANAALTQLGAVEDVVGVFDWLKTHATYVLTDDTAVEDGKWYFTRSGTSPNYIYEVVVSPSPDADPSALGYYELVSVKEAVQDYVTSHMALTDEGLWLQTQSSSSKILLASTGAYIYGDSGQQLAKYGTEASIGDPNGFHITISPVTHEIGFWRGSETNSANKVAYVSEDKLYITQSVVLQQMDIGEPVADGGLGQWSWRVHEIDGSNNLYLKWIG